MSNSKHKNDMFVEIENLLSTWHPNSPHRKSLRFLLDDLKRTTKKGEEWTVFDKKNRRAKSKKVHKYSRVGECFKNLKEETKWLINKSYKPAIPSTNPI